MVQSGGVNVEKLKKGERREKATKGAAGSWRGSSGKMGRVVELSPGGWIILSGTSP